MDELAVPALTPPVLVQLSPDLRSCDARTDALLERYRNMLRPRVVDVSGNQDNAEFLCSVCQSIDWSRFIVEPKSDECFPHYPDIEGAIKSAYQGCRLCQLIVEELEEIATRLQSTDNDSEPNGRNSIIIKRKFVDIGRLSKPKPGLGSIEFALQDNESLSHASLALFEIAVPHPYWGTRLETFCEFKSLATLRTPNAPVQSICPRYNWAKSMISKSCTEMGYVISKMPNRVIDCENLCLLETDSLRAPWVSLSHCWGRVPGLKTTMQNYKDMLKHIDLERIPKTVREAIIMTRVLGFQYLWVDTFCIIQSSGGEHSPDSSDWKSELNYMAHYYRDAIVTLSIESACGDEDGFMDSLCHHEPAASAIVPVCLSIEDNKTAFIVRRQPVEDTYLSHSHFCNEQTPLRKRAWTLQETVLSDRKIHISHDRMIWADNSCLLDDQLSCLLPRSISFDMSFTRQPQLKSSRYRINESELHGIMLELPGKSMDRSEIDYSRYRGTNLDAWYSMVEEFRRRNLTVSSDKLPAISAIAQEIGAITGYCYRHGIWMHDIIRGLAWFVCGMGGRPVSWRAPTWSWASLDIVDTPCHKLFGSFSNADSLIGPERLIALDLNQFRNDSEFQPIYPARLRLFAHLLRFEQWPGDFVILNPPLAATSRDESEGTYSGIFRAFAQLCRNDEQQDLLCEFDCRLHDRDFCQQDLRSLTLLNLGTWYSTVVPGSKPMPLFMAALMLEKVGAGIYRRLGMAMAPAQGMWQDVDWEWKELSLE